MPVKKYDAKQTAEALQRVVLVRWWAMQCRWQHELSAMHSILLCKALLPYISRGCTRALLCRTAFMAWQQAIFTMAITLAIMAK